MKPTMLTNEQTAAFCLALEHLIHAGIGTGDALTLLKADEQDPGIRAMLDRMAKNADAGAPLSAVIRDAEGFPGYVDTLIRVGERTGKLEQTLQALARYYESRERMERQLRTALIYPAALLGVLLVVAVVLLVWVLPIFNDVYARLGSSLTGIAGALLDLGRVLGRGMPVICIVLALTAAVLAVKPLRRGLISRFNRAFGDRGAKGKVLSARFVQALAMGISSGMESAQAAALACELSRGEAPAFQKRCESCREAVEKGSALSEALRSNGFLSPADRRLLDAGNRSGKAEAVLQQVARRMQEQAEEALERNMSMAEPALVAVACLLIAGVLLSVMLPLMHIMNAIG